MPEPTPTRRIGRPPTHGVRQVARQLAVVMPNGATVRLDGRTKTQLRRLEAEMAAEPFDALRIRSRGRVNRKELL